MAEPHRFWNPTLLLTGLQAVATMAQAGGDLVTLIPERYRPVYHLGVGAVQLWTHLLQRGYNNKGQSEPEVVRQLMEQLRAARRLDPAGEQ